jgi:hypothetical protein
MAPVQVTTPLPRQRPPVARDAPASGDARALTARRLAAWLGLAAVVGGALALAASAATAPTLYAPASRAGFPAWMSGPLHGLALGRLTGARFEGLVLLVCAGYVLALLGAQTLSLRAVLVAIALANLALMLGPVLLSQDAFGYVSFARLGALHGMDPYTHVSADVPGDAVFRYLGWRMVHSPYGPLFTLGSYALTPLGVGGMIWALKAIAALTALATAALVAGAAQRVGRSPALAAAFVGLNPVMLVYAVGGAHNDTLLVALLAAGVLLAAVGRRGRAAATLAVAVGIKASAGLVIPFLVLDPREWRERLRVLLWAAAALAVVAAVAVLGFGPHATGFVDALRGQQQIVATHSVPNEIARLFGQHGTHLPHGVLALTSGLRTGFTVAFFVVLAVCLVLTARGAEWTAMAGWATLALIISTAWLLPWYAIWLLPFAAVARDPKLRAAALALTAYAVLIRLPLAEPVLGGRRS